MDDIVATVEATLRHPGILAVEPVGSRAAGSPTPLSDWDFVVVTERFDEVARALPSLVAELEPLAQQWDRISAYPCYMLMLAGPVKVDLIFPDEPYGVAAAVVREHRDPRRDRPALLGLDPVARHPSARSGEDELVQRELRKMRDHLLGPLGVDRVPSSIEAAVEGYRSVRDEREREFGVEVSRRREHEVLPVLLDGLNGPPRRVGRTRLGRAVWG